MLKIGRTVHQLSEAEITELKWNLSSELADMSENEWPVGIPDDAWWPSDIPDDVIFEMYKDTTFSLTGEEFYCNEEEE